MSEAFAKYFTLHEVPSIVVFAEHTAYSLDILNALAQHYTGQIERLMFQSDEKDFLIAMKQLKTKLNDETYLLFLSANDANTIAGIKAMEKEGILELMKGKILGGEIVGGAGIYEAVGSALNGIKIAGLKSLAYFSERGQTIAEYFKTHYPIQSDVLWFIL
jgi:hypothetical protein